MSIVRRLNEIEMTLASADENFMDWVRGKSEEELVEIIKRLDREVAMAANLNKDTTELHKNLEIVRMIIERRALVEMLKDIDLSAPSSVLDGKTGYTIV